MAQAGLRIPSEAEIRYSNAAIFLHWTIAALIVVQVLLGWWLNEWVPDHSPIQAQITSFHISIGLTVLLLVLVRIGVRLTHRPPSPPAGTPRWERLLTALTHTVFYVLLLVLPLTGWAMVTLRGKPIQFWGLPWPSLPGVGALLGSPAPKAVRHGLQHLHVYILIWVVVLTLALHIAGVIWNEIKKRPGLRRMWPRRGVRSA